ncbi:beta-N-acetylglucosaminidase [hydrothermal vent metagenome]|uniref:beta-N-acetylhexosaminidase n=1 Tax=hydrothermal vent metagenome TaxID=652676 RepID=A0A3B0TSJ9_9ZZZZ
MRAFICGVSGLVLDAGERIFLSAAQPWGVILFARNIETPSQVIALVGEIRAALGRDGAPIVIDQEGGRVQRLRPPHWREYPPASRLAEIYRASAIDGIRAVALQSRLIAAELTALGIAIDCLPVLDVSTPRTHAVIGSRTYGPDPVTVATLGRAAAGGLLAGGCLPVIKHIPGHGRASADSHAVLPEVGASATDLETCDFVPFKALAHLPIAMTAHVLYTSLDKDKPATLSARILGEVIRGSIGFDGLLLSDDLSMAALSGDMAARAKGALRAGCDMALHCNGDMAEMEDVAAVSPELAGKALMRADAALALLKPPQAPGDAIDLGAAIAEFEALTGHKF